MKSNELEQWRAEMLVEQQAEIDAVKAKYKRKLGALSVLLEDDDVQKPVVAPRNGASTNASSTKLPKSFVFAAKEAIQQSPERFSTKQLFAYTQRKYPDFAKKPSDFSNALWVLRRDKEIEIVKKGGGKSPSIYKTTDSFSAVSAVA